MVRAARPCQSPSARSAGVLTLAPLEGRQLPWSSDEQHAVTRIPSAVPARRARLLRLLAPLGAVACVVAGVVGYRLAEARAAIDVRVQGAIVEGVDAVRYVVRVSPCRDVTTIAVGTAGAIREVRAVSEAVVVGDGSTTSTDGTS